MRFFKRPGSNFLDLIPVRKKGHVQEGDKVTLIVPKFRNERLKRLLIPGSRPDHFRVHLDATGSLIWQNIDGKKNVLQICNELFPNDSGTPLDNERRVCSFLSQLNKRGYIELITGLPK